MCYCSNCSLYYLATFEQQLMEPDGATKTATVRALIIRIRF